MLPMSLFLHPRLHSRAVAPADATPRTRRAPRSPQLADGTPRCDRFQFHNTESDDPAPAGLFTFRSERGSALVLAGRLSRHHSTRLGSSGDTSLAKHDSTSSPSEDRLSRCHPHVSGPVAADHERHCGWPSPGTGGALLPAGLCGASHVCNISSV